MTGIGVLLKLRVFDAATTNSRAHSIVKSTEVGLEGINFTITDVFTNLLAGRHTVSMRV
jgi:hypothetical protein